MTREKVFVYGTLRRSGSNHFRMAGATFVSAATARGRLYRIEWYPGLVLDENAGEIAGEVYSVTAEQLDQLDDYEGPEYHRVRVPVRAASGEILNAWVWEWLGRVDESKRITGGDWLKEAGV